MILVGQQNSPDQEPNINGQLNTMDGQYVPTVTQLKSKGLTKLRLMFKGRLKKKHLPLTQLRLTQMVTKIAITPSCRISC